MGEKCHREKGGDMAEMRAQRARLRHKWGGKGWGKVNHVINRCRP